MKKQPVTSKKATRKPIRHLRMPSAFTILFVIIGIVAALTWIIPSGQYQTKETEDGDSLPVAGTYKQTEKTQTNSDGNKYDVRQDIWDVIKAPIAGTVGQTEDASSGKQAISGGIEVMLFVLVIGGFLGVTMKTGALDAFFASILKKLKGKEHWLIPIMMTFFAIGGTTYGMQEETVAFYALVVPLLLAAGYNGMVAALVIILGSGAGLIGSIVNPFSVGIASGFANVSIGDGIIERIVIFVLSLVTVIWFTMRYAAKVKAGKYKRDSKAELADYKQAGKRAPAFTGRRVAVMSVFGLTFVAMVLAVIPWAGKFGVTFFENALAWLKDVPVLGMLVSHSVPFGDWWFNELSMLFLVSTFIIALIYYAGKTNKGGVRDVVGDFINGSRDLLAVALIIGVARGVTIVMSNGQIMDTVIHAGEQLLTGVGAWAMPLLSFLVFLPLSFFIPSSSGLATAVMPIFAPLADFANIDRQFIVTAYSTAVSIVNIIAPTIASVIGGLVLAKVSYITYIKRTWWLALILAAISITVMTISVLI